MNIAVMTAAGLAAGVEATEAATLVLAAGITGGWRPALRGAALGLVPLAAMAAAFGEVTRFVPVRLLEGAAGLVAAWIGQKWLRKGVARQLGRKAMRDEGAIFQRAVKEARPAFALAFQAVWTEGTEVLFIVAAVGARALASAVTGTAAAVIAVAGAAVLVRGPLTKVPENTLKLAVSVILLVMGIAWIGEAAGIW